MWLYIVALLTALVVICFVIIYMDHSRINQIEGHVRGNRNDIDGLGVSLTQLYSGNIPGLSGIFQNCQEQCVPDENDVREYYVTPPRQESDHGFIEELPDEEADDEVIPDVPETATKQKSGKKTPSQPARDFDAGHRMESDNDPGVTYEVMEMTNGRKRWRRYKGETGGATLDLNVLDMMNQEEEAVVEEADDPEEADEEEDDPEEE